MTGDGHSQAISDRTWRPAVPAAPVSPVFTASLPVPNPQPPIERRANQPRMAYS